MWARQNYLVKSCFLLHKLYVYSTHSSQHKLSTIPEAVDTIGRDSCFLQWWVDIMIIILLCNSEHGQTPLKVYCQECGVVLVFHHVLVMLLSQWSSPLVYVRFNTLPPIIIIYSFTFQYFDTIVLRWYVTYNNSTIIQMWIYSKFKHLIISDHTTSKHFSANNSISDSANILVIHTCIWHSKLT